MPYKYLNPIGGRVEFNGLLTVPEIHRLKDDNLLQVLQFANPVEPGNWRLLEKHLFKFRKDVCLRSYGHNSKCCELSFLTELPSLSALTIDCDKVSQLNVLSCLQRLRSLRVSSLHVSDFDFLSVINCELQELSLGPTKSKTPDLAGIVRFRRLESLALAGQQKQLQVISELKNLESLSLTGLSEPDLKFITELPKLWSFKMLLGGAKDLSVLENVRGLKELELIWIRGLKNLDFISGCRNLQKLTLERLRHVEVLPDFSTLKKLRRLIIADMNGLTNVDSIHSATALDTFSGSGKKLQPKDLRQALQSPRLKRATFYFSAKKKEAEFKQLATEYGVNTEAKHEEFHFKQ